MINVGKVEAMFSCKAQGMDVCFDPTTEEQFLSFKLALQVSLPQLLQQLLEFQRGGGGDAAGAAAAVPPAGPPLTAPPALMPVSIPMSQPSLPPPPVLPEPLRGSHMQNALGHQALEHHQLAQAQLGRVGLTPVVPPQLTQQNLQEPMRLTYSPSDVSWEARQMAAPFLDALRTSNMGEARRLLQQRADVNCESGPARMTPLHAALESGGSVDVVNLLLKAKSNVNAATATGKTPLHVAIQHFSHISPLVIRMLLCNQADLCLPDATGVTPLDSVRMLSIQANSAEGEVRIAVRQLLDEVTEQPTIDVGVVDGQVQGAHFADMQHDKVVINTESSIGVYSVMQRRIIFMKKLRQQQVVSAVKHISVNPELGTIAVCLEIVEPPPTQPGDRGKMQNVFIIWPNGKLQDEEPLKLSINVDPQPFGLALPACAILSRSRGPQLLLSRLVDGKVFSWRLNTGRSQLVSEAELTGNAGIVAASDDGCWIAVAVISQGSSHVNVYSYESPAGMLQEPRLVFSEPKSPQCMAIQEAGYNSPSGHLALAEVTIEGQPPPPIEISVVSADGSSRVLYRLKVPSPCCSLNFCHGVVTHILSGHSDGLAVLYDLQKGLTIQCHGSPATGCRSISIDRAIIAATESHCFRIFKVPSADAGA